MSDYFLHLTFSASRFTIFFIRVHFLFLFPQVTFPFFDEFFLETGSAQPIVEDLRYVARNPWRSVMPVCFLGGVQIPSPSERLAFLFGLRPTQHEDFP